MSTPPPELIRLLQDIAGSGSAGPEVSDRDAKLFLTNGAALLDTFHTFTPGQFIRPKQGLENGCRQPRGGLLMYRRPMNTEELASQRTIQSDSMNPDTVIMFGGRDSVALRLMPDGAVMEVSIRAQYFEPVEQAYD